MKAPFVVKAINCVEKELGSVFVFDGKRNTTKMKNVSSRERGELLGLLLLRFVFYRGLQFCVIYLINFHAKQMFFVTSEFVKY